MSGLAAYEILRPLGGGGMGEVYLAHRAGAGGFSREVALKVIRADKAADPRQVERFLREGRALAALNHRGIVAVFDQFEDEGRLYLAMEYLHGVTVRQLLDRCGPLAWEMAAHVGTEVAQALTAAHTSRLPEAPDGLVHRDLSPSNIMACADGAVKLLDFGLARPAGREASVSGFEGKLRYLAPEAAAGVPPDPAADVYALGVVLYELVTGQSPFPEVNELALVHAILHAQVEPPSRRRAGVLRAFDRLVLRAMARDRGERPSAGELARELETLVAGRCGPPDVAALVDRAMRADRGGAAGPVSASSLRAPRRSGWRRAGRSAVLAAAVLAVGALAVVGAVRLARPGGAVSAGATPGPATGDAGPGATAARPDGPPLPAASLAAADAAAAPLGSRPAAAAPAPAAGRPAAATGAPPAGGERHRVKASMTGRGGTKAARDRGKRKGREGPRRPPRDDRPVDPFTL